MSALTPNASSRSRFVRMTMFLLACVLAVGIFQDAGLLRSNPLAPVQALAADPFSEMFTIGSDGTLSATSAAQNTDFAKVVTKYRNIALVLTSILTITMLIFMLIQFTKLGGAGDNEMARKKAIMGILTTGIATALLGSATIVIGFFWNALAS